MGLDIPSRCFLRRIIKAGISSKVNTGPIRFIVLDMKKYLEGVGMLVKLPDGAFMIEKENAHITKFLNRILGLPVHAQNCLFQYFNDIITALIAEAKQDGTYDQGIMDLGVGGDKVQEHESREFCGVTNGIPFKVILHKIGVERGVSWEKALEFYNEHKGPKVSFLTFLFF